MSCNVLAPAGPLFHIWGLPADLCRAEADWGNSRWIGGRWQNGRCLTCYCAGGGRRLDSIETEPVGGGLDRELQVGASG